MNIIRETPGKAFWYLDKYDRDRNSLLDDEEFATLAAEAAEQHADLRVDGNVAQWLEGKSTENKAVFNIFKEDNEIERLEITLDEEAKKRIEYWDFEERKWSKFESLEQFKTEVIDELDD